MASACTCRGERLGHHHVLSAGVHAVAVNFWVGQSMELSGWSGRAKREIVMTKLKTKSLVLAGTISALALAAAPVQTAFAQGIGADVGVSVGGDDGVSAGASASVGGGGGVDADVGASVGDDDGVDADVDVSVGDDDGVDADVSASVGGDDGIDADVGVGVGGDDGVNADAGVNVGGDDGADVDVGVGIGDGAAPGAGGGSGTDVDRPALQARVDQMSDSEVAELRDRCEDVLADPGRYDRELAVLCELVVELAMQAN